MQCVFAVTFDPTQSHALSTDTSSRAVARNQGASANFQGGHKIT